MLPTKAQWKKWSLPSKYTAIGTVLAIISAVVWLISTINNPKALTATEYAKNTQWYLDVKLTAKNMPEEFKTLTHTNTFLIDDFKKQVKDTFGVKSNEYKTAASITDAGSLFEAVLFISKQKLEITDSNLKFTTGTDVEEMHTKSRKNIYECTSSSFEYRSSTAEIVRVTKKNGIHFNVPPAIFTEHSGCNTKKVQVNYAAANATISGRHLIITLPKGYRFWEEKNGKKVVKRKDARLYFTLKPTRNKQLKSE